MLQHAPSKALCLLRSLFILDHLGNYCLPVLNDFHEISIQQAWLPGRQWHIQLICEERGLSNESGAQRVGKVAALVQRSKERW